MSRAFIGDGVQKIITKIDSFQRRKLRSYVLNIKYPKIVRNEELYRITKQKQWSIQIKIRRLKWIGYVYRLGKNTPAAQSLRHATENYNTKRGRKESKLAKVSRKTINRNKYSTNKCNEPFPRQRKMEKHYLYSISRYVNLFTRHRYIFAQLVA